jgi:hypothetical protein
VFAAFKIKKTPQGRYFDLWSATLGYNQKIDTSKTDFFLHAFNIAIFVEKHKHFFQL